MFPSSNFMEQNPLCMLNSGHIHTVCEIMYIDCQPNHDIEISKIKVWTRMLEVKVQKDKQEIRNGRDQYLESGLESGVYLINSFWKLAH